MAHSSSYPFGTALGELLLERDYATQTGKPNWSAFAAELEGMHYETLRRAVIGRRTPSRRLLEECARILGIRAEYFLEYRLYLARRQLDPDEVGLERAAQALEAWQGTPGTKRRAEA